MAAVDAVACVVPRAPVSPLPVAGGRRVMVACGVRAAAACSSEAALGTPGVIVICVAGAGSTPGEGVATGVALGDWEGAAGGC